MIENNDDFSSLPEKYRKLIELAQDRHKIKIEPLQLLTGGRTDAIVSLVSVSSTETNQIEHCILKLDRKSKFAKSDEETRHHTVLEKAPSHFSRNHIPELAFNRVEYEDALAIFYRIAGQSLLKYRPLSRFDREIQLKAIFQKTNTVLLSDWNANLSFDQAVHPQKVLEKWLGFRLDADKPIEQFLRDKAQVNPDINGLLINGKVFPNPLFYARNIEPWGDARLIDIATGFLHRDLNTNNILVRFADNGTDLDGYFLIDFALFKEEMPLLYDQRYLEMSYMILLLDQISFEKFVDLITMTAEEDKPDSDTVPIEMSGVSAVINTTRLAFDDWVHENYPSLQDDLWAQYWLAGVAAGLSYAHKSGLLHQKRMAGLIYAAANLKRYLTAFNLPRPTRIELLYDRDQYGVDTSSKPVVKKPKHNLPAQATPFIGRKKEISSVKELLMTDDIKLVTLVGAGGTGKTRLCLQVGQELLDDFQDGVYFVPLADDRDADQLVSRIAQQLGVREGGRPLLENLKDYLSDKHLMLILDNFEQLVTAAPTVSELLTAAPRLKIVTTSRIPLNLQSEHIFQVPPLNIPEWEDGASVESLKKNESVSLFVERAQSVQHSFRLSEKNAPAVVEICRNLDGLPLAIELAAARVNVLQPKAILDRLDNKLRLLSGGSRDLPSRHQTIRNTLAWSYDLLDEEERTLHSRLSVFVGGFTFESAEAVCNPEGNFDILEGLISLVNNSLIRREETGNDETRFGMLETIRTYAHEKLSESGELSGILEAHARYFANMVIDRVGYGIFSENAVNDLNWLERELDNIRATLSWCLTEPGDIELGVRVISDLIWFFYRRGYFIEGFNWAERMLEAPELQAPSRLRALALHNHGTLAIWKGEQDKGLAHLEESLAYVRRDGNHELIGSVLISNSVALINMGRDRDAKPLLEEAQEIFRDQEQDYFLTIALVHLGNVELGIGNPDEARKRHKEALSVAKTINENWLLSFVKNNLGEVARTQGRFDQARKYYEECMALLGDTGDRGDIARFIHSLGYIAQHEEEFKRAESQFRKSLTLFRQLGNRRGIAESLAGLAGLKARQGHVKWGATLLGAAQNLLQSTGGDWWPADRLEVDQNIASMKFALSEAEFNSAWETGTEMSIDQAVNFASNEP